MADSDGGEGWPLLSAALQSLPLPGSTPERSTREALGLHLVSSALRLDHIERISERLTLADATHMTRQLDVDIDLGLLSDERRDGLAFTSARQPSRQFLWIPVGRHPRASLGPIALTDGQGATVPRVTSTETNRLVATGVIRLLSLLVEAAPDVTARREYTSDRLARWLIHAAVLSLIQEGRREFPQSPFDSQSADIRRRADQIVRGVLGLVPGDERHAFLDLLAELSRDQVVVAELDPSLGRVRVSYRAPELRAADRRRLGWLWERPGEFRFRYDTRVPGDVDSFHVLLTVPAELEIHRMVVVSEADVRAAKVLRSDVRRLRLLVDETVDSLGGDEAAEQVSWQDHPSLVPYELRSIRSRFAELARRRMQDLLAHGPVEVRKAPAADTAVNLRILDEAEGSTVATASRLVVADSGPAAGRDDRLSLPALSGLLTRIERLMAAADLGLDLRSNNDPAETSGHVQWRRQASGLEPPLDPSVPARVLVTVADAAPSHAQQILGLLVGNLILVSLLFWGFRSALLNGDDPTNGSEVTVTLLLLVPGLLISRLVAWSGRSILFPLLLVPQVAAYMSMLMNVAFALVLVIVGDARDDERWIEVLAAPVAGLAVLLVVVAVHVLRERAATHSAIGHDEGLPAWLFEGIAGRGRVRGGARPPTVRFVEGGPPRRRRKRGGRR